MRSMHRVSSLAIVLAVAWLIGCDDSGGGGGGPAGGAAGDAGPSPGGSGGATLDREAPRFGPIDDLLFEQISPAGATPDYPPPAATDDRDPAPSVACDPAPGALFPPGDTTVRCTATDAAGNQGEGRFTLTVQDSIAPALALSAEGEAQTVLRVAFDERGSGVGPDGLAALLDGDDATADFELEAESFVATLVLAPGDHTLEVTVTDVAGNRAEDTLVFQGPADPVAPALEIVSPAADTCAGPSQVITLRISDEGSGLDEGSFEVHVNDADATGAFTLDGAGGATALLADVGVLVGAALPEGPVSLLVRVQDRAGNQASAARDFRFDATGPSLGLRPADGAIVPAGADLEVVVAYDDPCAVDLGSVTVRLNADDVTPAFAFAPGEGRATLPGPMAGAHVLEASATDGAGNESRSVAMFAVLASLRISVSGPPDALPLGISHDLTVQAAGFVGPVWVTTSEGLPPADGLLLDLQAADAGAVTAAGAALFRTLGPIVVTATALEAPELSGSVQLTVVLTHPVITPPPPALLDEDGRLAVMGFSFPAQAVALVVDGEVLASAEADEAGGFTIAAPLPEGDHVIWVQADDPLGGESRRSGEHRVRVPAPRTVELRAAPAGLTLARGEVEPLQITQVLSTGARRDVSDVTRYVSDDDQVADVDDSGTVTALAPGHATITARFDGAAVIVPVEVGPTGLESTSPSHGDDSVAVTRETILRFTAPIAAASVTPDAIFAQFGGERLPARLHLSERGDRVTLFYQPALPASARVRITIDGDRLRDDTGTRVDPDGDGVAGGVAVIDFDTLSLTVVEGTTVCGRVFASELGEMGGEAINVPLEGVRITVDGMEEELFAVTDALGDFRLDPAPSGRFFVHIDGREAVNWVPEGAYYPYVGRPFTSIPEAEVNVGNIHLPLVQAGALQDLNPDDDTTVEFVDEVLQAHPELDGVHVRVPPGSLINDDGSPGGQVGIAPVPPDRVPGQLPGVFGFDVVITVQTDGATNFDSPAAACFPNDEGLEPGARSALWSFNHDAGQWEIQGSMTVSADGRLVCTDEGVGINAPGWHGSQSGTQGFGGRLRGGGGAHGRADPAGDEPRCEGPNGEDCPCESACVAGAEVFVHSGEEHLSRTDLEIRGRGAVRFRLTRSYRSRIGYDGPLGHGWDFNYNDTLHIDPDAVRRQNGDAHLDAWEDLGDGTYGNPSGFYSSLVRNLDGSYTLRAPDGFKRIYDANGRLAAHEDRAGNRMLFFYDGQGDLAVVVDPYGREIRFHFTVLEQAGGEPRARLTSVMDFAGREVVYTYDARGDLVAVRGPIVVGTSTGNDFPDGRTEAYTYSFGFDDPALNHNLLTVTAPEEVAVAGPPFLRLRYGEDRADPLTYDKVIAESEGGTNRSGVEAGGIRTFHYEPLNQDEPEGQLALPRGKATVVEPNGRTSELFVNERGHHILTRVPIRGARPGERQAYESRRFYNDDGRLVRLERPEGDAIEYVFDEAGPRRSASNLIEIRRISGPRGEGEDLVTTMTYEPLFNQLACVTGPRGNAQAFTPPLGVANPERYTTCTFYDYQESAAPVPEADLFGIDLDSVRRGLGDLNGDGRTDQMAGLPVRVEASVQLLPGSNEATRLGATTQAIVTERRYNDRGQLLALVDAEGSTAEFGYHPANDPEGDRSPTFSAHMELGAELTGYLCSQTVDSDNVSPRRQAAAPPANLETRIQTDALGRVTMVLDPRGVAQTFEVNALGEVVAMVAGAEAPLLRRWRYDHNGRRVGREIENRRGLTPGVGAFIETELEFDILGNLVARTDELDAQTQITTHFGYDPSNLLVEIVRPTGERIEQSWDERDLLASVTRGAGTPEAAELRYDYDGNGALRTITDAADSDGDGRGETSRIDRDGFGRALRIVDRMGNEQRRTYDVASNTIAREVFGHPASDPGGALVRLAATETAYDELGRPFEIRSALFVAEGFAPSRAPDLRDGDGDGVVLTRLEHDALSRHTYRIEDDGAVAQWVYDGVGRPIEMIDAAGNRRQIRYDENGNPIAYTSVEISPEGLVPDAEFTTLFRWDPLNRLVRVTDNAGQTTRLSYDARGNLIERSDPEGPLVADPLGAFPDPINAAGNTTTWTYDGLGRLLREIRHLRVGGRGDGVRELDNAANPDGQVRVRYEYDESSRIVAMTDDAGNQTSYAYDALDRIARRENADGTRWAYVYNGDDDLTEVTQPDGTVVANTYDGLGRLVTRTVRPADGVLGAIGETYGYDGLSRLTRAVTSDAEGGEVVVERTYDALSRLLEERLEGAVVSSVFEGDGRRAAYTHPGGRRVELGHDAIDRVSSARDAGGEIFQARYIGPGLRELTRSLGDGSALSFEGGYDEIRQVTELRVDLPDGMTGLDRTYGYSRAGLRTFEVRADDGALTDRYTYDSTGRLARTEYDLEGDQGAARRDVRQVDYQLDGVGNRVAVRTTDQGDRAQTQTYQAGPMNEYTQIAGVERSHTPKGNLADDGERTYAYDFRDRLVEVARAADGALVAEYGYDAIGRRAWKRVYDPDVPADPPTLTRFLYDGWRVVETQDEGGQTLATIVYSPVHVDAPVQIARTAAHPLGAAVLYLHQDARGDVVLVTDDAGRPLERRTYDDFGAAYDEVKAPAPPSALGSPFGFQGGWYDAETGLYWLRYRHYDPRTGRFLQRDPVLDPVNAGNEYTFVGHSPISRRDPLGLSTGASPDPASSNPLGGANGWTAAGHGLDGANVVASVVMDARVDGAQRGLRWAQNLANAEVGNAALAGRVTENVNRTAAAGRNARLVQAGGTVISGVLSAASESTTSMNTTWTGAGSRTAAVGASNAALTYTPQGAAVSAASTIVDMGADALGYEPPRASETFNNAGRAVGVVMDFASDFISPGTDCRGRPRQNRGWESMGNLVDHMRDDQGSISRALVEAGEWHGDWVGDVWNWASGESARTAELERQRRARRRR